MANLHTYKLGKMLKASGFTERQVDAQIKNIWDVTRGMVTKEDLKSALHVMEIKIEAKMATMATKKDLESAIHAMEMKMEEKIDTKMTTMANQMVADLEVVEKKLRGEISEVNTDLKLLRKDVEGLFYKMMVGTIGSMVSIITVALTIFGYIIHH